MRQLLRNRCLFSTSIRERIRQERESRLNKGQDATTLTTKTLSDIAKIRNIGIIAHIDAGKTTTTERMLYYAGALPSPGNIDEGTTTMDYMSQERERGITIRSAAISFNWNQHQINLIDTPGHVDFSGEVYRSLRVLDGVVTILDAVKGVQAQTMKVCNQASRFNIPKIFYLNKMDRIGASYQQSVDSLIKKIGVRPLVLQHPIGDGDTFKGVIDLVEMEQVLFEGNYGEELKKVKLSKNTSKYSEMTKIRQKIIETVADFDDEIADLYLNDNYVPSYKLKDAIRKLTLGENQKIAPVLMGSSFKNKGVQPILNSVVDYLPSPLDRPPVKSSVSDQAPRVAEKQAPFTGYVFKVLYDLQKGPLAYTRIYSGELSKKMQVNNASKSIPEKIDQILRVRANQYVPIQQISAGDIIALSGLKNTMAGDTLTLGSDDYVLDTLDIPNPIFTAPFELQSAKNQREFDEAINRSVIEDSSLSYSFETETGQYLVSGLGELHLQILRDKLNAEGISVKMGNLKINFKETVSREDQGSKQIKNELKPTQFEQFNIQMRIVPLRDESGKIENRNQVLFLFERVPEFDSYWDSFLRKKKLANTTQRANELYTKEQLHKLKKAVRNPTFVEPIDQEGEKDDEDDDSEDEESVKKRSSDEDPYYHMNTLPFETLYELVEACQTSMLYGKNRLPAVGIQLQILNGKYKKSSFSKSVMNRCASSLARSLIDRNSSLVEPIMEFSLEGEEVMIDVALKEVIRKRGRIQQQSSNSLTGFIPAEGVRGWIKQLRSMGLQIQLKFFDYEQVIGANPQDLLKQNQ